MARIPFVDTHFHLHDMKRPELRYAWLEPDAVHPFLGNIDAIKAQHYWMEDYIAEIRFANVPKAIHVQAALGIKDPVDETRWLQGFAEKFGYPQGIVAECHLAEPDAGAVLERHMQFANVRGIRDFGPGEYLSNPAWQAGYKLLARHNLVSCLDTRLEKFPQILALTAKAPDVVLCVDHCAIPEKRTKEYFEAWNRGIRELARGPNIWMKISGLGMGDHRWTVESLKPWVLGCIEAFTPARVVFGTNWPVDRMYSSYPDLIDAYAEIIGRFSEAEQRAMFAGNAEKLFRI
jgi:predicted TIM-barrel fold metal-dependent hydrolase